MTQNIASGHRHVQVITVFGGTGFIGRHVIKRLAAAGDIIRVAGRYPERAHFLQPSGSVGQIVPWPVNYTNPQSVTAALQGADVAINLVGILYESGFGSRRQTFDKIHVDIPEAIAKAANRTKIKHLVHVSAIGADPQAEAAYAHSKGKGEMALCRAFPKATILRPSVVFGAEDDFFNRFASLAWFSPVLPVLGCPFPCLTFPEKGDPRKLPIIDIYGPGGPRFQPVFVGDVADACQRVSENPKTAGSIYELGGPVIYHFYDLMRLLLKHINRRRFLAPVPLPIAKMMALVLEQFPRPLLTRDQVRLLENDTVVSEDVLTFSDLGITPMAAEAILPSYLSRYKPRHHEHG